MNSSENFNSILSDHIALVKSRVLLFCNNKNDFDDYLQEGLLGLSDAVKAYNSEMNCSFESFAKLCIDRKLIAMLRYDNKKSRIPPALFSDSDVDLVLNFSDNPEDYFVNYDKLVDVTKLTEIGLSGLERDVLNKFIYGYNFTEICEMLKVSKKTVYNAFGRAKKKITSYFHA
ncbi:MAG: sigma-70 family RNA polymerase sigma factor [bacterium]|nr:sigma-70 family RNA polymerase sigma factor [bacterium]